MTEQNNLKAVQGEQPLQHPTLFDNDIMFAYPVIHRFVGRRYTVPSVEVGYGRVVPAVSTPTHWVADEESEEPRCEAALMQSLDTEAIKKAAELTSNQLLLTTENV